MGQAKNRKAEIEALKRSTRGDAARWKLSPDEEKGIEDGIDPTIKGPSSAVSMARALHKILEQAKADSNVDVLVAFLNFKVNATVYGLRNVEIACGRGCSHCCHTWVSASVPEVLAIAKIARQRGDAFIQKIKAAHEATKQFNFVERAAHSHPCAFLHDNMCSIYDVRPKACRLAVSTDAEICRRAFIDVVKQDLSIPGLYFHGRTLYDMAYACALKESKFPHQAYELNDALVRALETENAEQAWLLGENIFEGVKTDPTDLLSSPEARFLYQEAFGHSLA